jgi:hypothetical protein
MGMRIRQVVIDSSDPRPLADFWAAATGRSVVDEDPVYTSVEDPTDRDALLVIQHVEGPPKQGKNRVHIDLLADDPHAEAKRLVPLGASLLENVEEGGVRWVVLADPQGNEFCIIKTGEAD